MHIYIGSCKYATKAASFYTYMRLFVRECVVRDKMILLYAVSNFPCVYEDSLTHIHDHVSKKSKSNITYNYDEDPYRVLIVRLYLITETHLII